MQICDAHQTGVLLSPAKTYYTFQDHSLVNLLQLAYTCTTNLHNTYQPLMLKISLKKKKVNSFYLFKFKEPQDWFLWVNINFAHNKDHVT